MARKAELLPVPYFHVVFTMPYELNPIASYNPEVIYNLLFKSAWATVETLGLDKKRLNGKTGMLGFLHTWGKMHCLIYGILLKRAIYFPTESCPNYLENCLSADCRRQIQITS
jgi:hypothetical protein